MNRYGWKSYIVEVYRELDITVNVIPQITNAGGFICGVVVLPLWNTTGHKVGEKFAVVYQAESEITSIEVWT